MGSAAARPPPLAPSKAARAAPLLCPAATSPEQGVQRLAAVAAAVRPRRRYHRPNQVPKPSPGELLLPSAPFPGRFRRRIAGIWVGAAALHASRATLRALEKSQGVFREPGTYL
jgi:hypothetical protein